MLTQPKTLDQIQLEIHALFQSGIDVPANTDDDYKFRTVLINKFIGDWQMRPGITWRELLDVSSDKTYSASTPQITCPPQFADIAGKVWLVSGGQRYHIPYLSQERLDDDIMPPAYCYVSGKAGAKSLNFVGVASSLDGASVVYRFERYALELAAPEDVPDMSDPRFIVSSVVARLFQLGRNTTGYSVNSDDAEEYMSGMIIRNTSRKLQETELPIGLRIKSVGAMGR